MIVVLVDVHCHLESDLFEGRLDGILADAREAGIARLITSSITPEQWPLTRAIAARYEMVDFSLGVHPWYGKPGDLGSLAELASEAQGAVAIGEIGLDLKVERPGLDLQRALFEAQLAVARETGLPVIVHCRGAWNELIQSLKRMGPPPGGIVHSFSGSEEVARELMKYNLSFSMGGVLTYRNSRRRERLLRVIYPDRFLLETDSPDIPPVGLGGQPNVPANILLNLRAAAAILGEPEEKVAESTTGNAARIFGLRL